LPVSSCNDGGFSGATMDRPALQRLLADITAGRASVIRSAASSPTSSPEVRYWNRARQRYHRLSARHSRARVSLPTQAARPGPDNRGKPRLLDPERRIPARDRFAPDSPLEEAVTSEPVSANEKFPASREFTGNFIENGPRPGSMARKIGGMSERYGRIPYASEQGIYLTTTGN
jgi:hypothetical protein